MTKSTTGKRARTLAEVQAVLTDCYPTLHIIETTPRIVIRGVFPVHLEHELVGQFLIEITIPNTYPATPPSVKEMGRRIPRIQDRHVYPTTGELCPFLADERWKYWRPADGFETFLTKPLNDYFLSQLYFEQHGTFPFGDRRHGVFGILDYYAEELEITDIQIIGQCLYYLSKKEIKGVWKCYCGSGKRMRQCHWEKIKTLRENIPHIVAAVSFARVVEYISSNA